jgi:hypothetical protein
MARPLPQGPEAARSEIFILLERARRLPVREFRR